MRCTKCDFEVLRVADRAWKDDVEYLFFRNFYPNLEKLQSKLVKAPGVYARACMRAQRVRTRARNASPVLLPSILPRLHAWPVGPSACSPVPLLTASM